MNQITEKMFLTYPDVKKIMDESNGGNDDLLCTIFKNNLKLSNSSRFILEK